MRRLYLDLDGVMADFDGAFPAVFGLDHRSMADDDMWLKINGHPTFFRDLPAMPGAIEFFRAIEHLDPIILTACPKSNYAHVATQKVEWVRAHLSSRVTVLPVLGGANKPLFMHAKGDILIDDYRRNTEAWSAAGGVAILHRGFDATASELTGYVALLAAQVQRDVMATPLTGKYGAVLTPFLGMMEHELHANSDKGDRPGWLSMDRKTGLLEIFYHVAKLQMATKDNDIDRIREHSADVANMAMMLADVCGALEQQNAPIAICENPAAAPVVQTGEVA